MCESMRNTEEQCDEYVQNVHTFCSPEELQQHCKNPNCEKFGNCGDPNCGIDGEETYGERFLGVMEVVPEPLRRITSRVYKVISIASKRIYCSTCYLGWYLFLASAILFGPLLFEIQYNRRIRAIQAKAAPTIRC